MSKTRREQAIEVLENVVKQEKDNFPPGALDSLTTIAKALRENKCKEKISVPFCAFTITLSNIVNCAPCKMTFEAITKNTLEGVLSFN